ncbi:retropepsin-like aspartic protease family protein [Comamonas antarctica]|uniref:TIGR02281 family clan AA aspartic protease n=1 Tax=Comamonas antarctica TaxID=2743470 RepID=A0A6N1X6C5_9BURK|nr:TIGR02281 family clan AA aspartic protease [Comamonas antarctica]QKV53632.1 TIGR02281 family clan AA aspartic protease [Comamonas antarctica]
MGAAAWLATAGVLGLCLAPASANAQSVALAGILGSKALLVIDGGAPRSLAAGDSLGAVRVLQVGRDDALLDIAGRQQRLQLGAAPVQLGAGRPADAGPSDRRPARLVLYADSQGHFIEQGLINGQSMRYLIDTGASTVAIGRAEADRLGLPYLQGQSVQMGTANGAVRAWRLRLDSVRIGGLEARGVDAVVTPQPMPFVLLGNSFLAQFHMTRQDDQMVLEKRR